MRYQPIRRGRLIRDANSYISPTPILMFFNQGTRPSNPHLRKQFHVSSLSLRLSDSRGHKWGHCRKGTNPCAILFTETKRL